MLFIPAFPFIGISFHFSTYLPNISRVLKEISVLINARSAFGIWIDDNSIQKECFLRSLTEINDSEDMWKRYANNSQGICIEYNSKELLTAINMPLLPVCYGKKIAYDAKTFSSLSKMEIFFMNFLFKDKVGINGEDWYSQREWRIMAFRKNLGLSETEQKGKCIRIIKPTKIILGKNVSNETKCRIINWKKMQETKNYVLYNKNRLEKGIVFR